MNRSARTLATVLLALGLAGCAARGAAGGSGKPAQLLVFAAASLTEAFGQLGAEFEAAHPGTEVLLNMGASQALRIQIEEGAQADVFASANRSEAAVLMGSGLVAQEGVHVFARNRLVVVLPADNPAGLTSLRDLTHDGVRIVLADAAVPIGKYTLEALDSMAQDEAWGSGFRQAVLANVVSQEETVRAVLAKVQIGEADAGFVFATDAGQYPELPALPLPLEHNPEVEYAIAVLRAAPQADTARDFVDFVLGEDGRRVLETYGFLPPAQ